MKEKIKSGMQILITIILCGSSSYLSYASDLDLSWLTQDGNGTFDEAKTSFQGIFASAYGLVMVVAAALMVLFLILAAIMYAGGSSRTKDDAKAKIFGVFIGCFLVFAAVAIVSLIAGIAAGAFV